MGLSFANVKPVHPILERYRNQASFKAEKLTYFMYEGGDLTDKKRKMFEATKEEMEKYGPTPINQMNRVELYDECIRRHCAIARIVRKHPEWNNFTDIVNLMRIVLQYFFSGLTVHESMFIDMIENQTTDEQKNVWMNKIKNYSIVGTYAQTELGHGTNVRGLETTATFDKEHDQFVLDTPTLTSTKFWPGGLGKTCNHAVVMAQLIIDGANYGVHPFITQLRDTDTHMPLPGIEIGDIGTKLGWNGIDNGYLRLDKVRIPRCNMLMKYFVVHRDGRYEKIGASDKTIYATLVYARSLCGGYYGGRMVIMAATVATRRCLVARCSDGSNKPLFDNRIIRNTLLTELASGFGIWFAGNALLNDYSRLLPKIMNGDSSSLPTLHAISSGYKALSTAMGPQGVENCRRCCGEVGGLLASGMPTCADNVSPGVTIDGDNTVMYLQLARYLVKLERQKRENDSNFENYIDEDVFDFDVTNGNPGMYAVYLTGLHRLMARRLMKQAFDRLTSSVTSEGLPLHVAWNKASVDLVLAAEAYTLSHAVKSFHDVILSYGNDRDGGPDNDDENLRAVLLDVFCLFAVHTFVSRVNNCLHLMSDKLSPAKLRAVQKSIDILVDKLAPNAVALGDGLDISDIELDSCIGCYSGNTDEQIVGFLSDTHPYNGRDDLLKPLLAGLKNYIKFNVKSKL